MLERSLENLNKELSVFVGKKGIEAETEVMSNPIYQKKTIRRVEYGCFVGSDVDTNRITIHEDKDGNVSSIGLG